MCAVCSSACYPDYIYESKTGCVSGSGSPKETEMTSNTDASEGYRKVCDNIVLH